MQDLSKKDIWVVDPGMMEAGGHHAALAETLCQYKSRLTDVEIQIFASKHLDKNLLEGFRNVGIKSHEVFECNFYQHFDDSSSLGPSGMQFYIRNLAKEYFGVLKQAIIQSNKKAIIFLLPCLNWEHANAFSLACRLLEHELNAATIHVVACAMYSPRFLQEKQSAQAMCHAMAFRELKKFNFVSLYGSEHELCREYGDLLSCEPLAIHPCYLMDWDGIKKSEARRENKFEKGTYYLLYLGDAKENKGFNRLPKILAESLKNTPLETKFIIQFTLAWEYPEIMDTVLTLKRMAAHEPRLMLHHGFWSNDEVLNILSNVKGAICTYDISVYQHKSSGLIWILAFLHKTFLISGDCWLSREAERLNLNVYQDPNLEVKNLEGAEHRQDLASSIYSQTLFSSLIEWLASH